MNDDIDKPPQFGIASPHPTRTPQNQRSENRSHRRQNENYRYNQQQPNFLGLDNRQYIDTPGETSNSLHTYTPRKRITYAIDVAPKARKMSGDSSRNNASEHLWRGVTPNSQRRNITPKTPKRLTSLWVTVFGFDATTRGADVLTYFESVGDILDHQPGLQNSIDLMFSTKAEAEYALAQDGLRVNIGADRTTCIMIGVKPCKNPPDEGIQRTGQPAVRSASRLMNSGGGRSRSRPRKRKNVAPPEMETESRHGRSTFQHSNQGMNQRYSAILKSPGYRREPRKDLSCCQMALRYLWPTD
jgi:hypothetical protein